MSTTFTLDPATDIRNRHGAPGWHELVTPDPDAAAGYLAEALGWELVEYEPMPGYRVAQVEGHGIGGIRGPLPGEDAGPRWITYVAVDDADATVAAAQAAGAEILLPPTQMAEVGRAAVLSHPASGTQHVLEYARPFA